MNFNYFFFQLYIITSKVQYYNNVNKLLIWLKTKTLKPELRSSNFVPWGRLNRICLHIFHAYVHNLSSKEDKIVNTAHHFCYCLKLINQDILKSKREHKNNTKESPKQQLQKIELFYFSTDHYCFQITSLQVVLSTWI